MLYHVSEEPGILRFDPRAADATSEPVVWAVSEDRLRNYLLPRDCPRVTFFAGERTRPEDIDRFLASAHSVVAFESAWLNRVRNTRLCCYRLPPTGFKCVDACAGYFQSASPVIPDSVEVVDDLLYAIRARGAEVRIVPSLWPLHDAVVASSLSYSIIRMRNAAPRQR